MWNNGGFVSEVAPAATQIPANVNGQHYRGGAGESPYEETMPYQHAGTTFIEPPPTATGYLLSNPQSNLQSNPQQQQQQQHNTRRFFGIPIRVSIPPTQPQAFAYTNGALDAQSPNYVLGAQSPSTSFQPANNMESLGPVPAAQSPAALSNTSADDGKPNRTGSKRTGRPPIWSAQKTRQLIRNYLWSPSKLPRTLQFFHADEHPDQPPLSDERAKSQQNGAQKKLNQTIARDPRRLKGNERDLSVLNWRVSIPDRSPRHVARVNAAGADVVEGPPERQHTMMSIKMAAVPRSFTDLSINSRKAFSLLKNLTLRSEPESTISRQVTGIDPTQQQHQDTQDDETYVPLPGDLLTLDSQGVNVAYTPRPDHGESHVTCDLIWAELRDEPNIWVTPNGLSQKAKDVLLQLANAPASVDLAQRDCFGNTVLHLLAARKDLQNRLISVFGKARVTLGLLMTRNTARQTFLHVLAREWFVLQNMNSPIFTLLGKLEEIDAAALIFSQLAPLRDVYGQTIFHRIKICLPEPKASDMIQAIEAKMMCDQDIEYLRDAFGSLVVEPVGPPHPSSLGGQVVKPTDGQTLPFRPYNPLSPTDVDINSHIVAYAVADKHVEDGQGYGALHCLAAICSKAQPGRKRKASEPLDPGRSPGYSRDTTPGDAMASPSAAGTGNNNNNSPTSEDPMSEICHKAETLIAAGCSVSHYDRTGKTALMAFIEHLPADTLKIPLLKILVDAAKQEDMLEARNREGETALLFASRLGKIAAVRELAAAGANQYVRSGRHGCVRGVLETIQHEQAKHKHDPPNLDSPWGRLEASLKVLAVPERDNLAPYEPKLVKYPDVVDEWGL